MPQQQWLPDPVAERAKELREEQDFSSIGEAVRYMCRSGVEYDV